jgi:hypothetical protein
MKSGEESARFIRQGLDMNQSEQSSQFSFCLLDLAANPASENESSGRVSALRPIGKARITLGRDKRAQGENSISSRLCGKMLGKITMAKLSVQGQLAPLLLGLWKRRPI